MSWNEDIERFSRRLNGSWNKGNLYAASLAGRKKYLLNCERIKESNV